MRSARFEGDEGRCNPSHAPGWLMFRPEMFQRSGCGKQRRHGASRCDRDRPDETVAYDKASRCHTVTETRVLGLASGRAALCLRTRTRKAGLHS